MKKILLVLVLAFSVSGCAGITRLVDSASSVTVTEQQITIARNSFASIEVTATNYLNLTRCDKTTSKVCRTKEVSAVLGPAVINARKARNDLVAFQRSHPGELGTAGLYDALQLAVTTLTGIMDTYHIGAVQ